MFDGELEVGSLDSNTGEPTQGNHVRSVNFTRIKPNTTYIITNNGEYRMGLLRAFDINGNMLPESITTTNNAGFSIFTTQSSAYKIRFRTTGGTNPIDTNIQFQIEIGEQTATPYEPYTESLQYTPVKDSEGNLIELRSVPNGVKDEINADGELVKRVSDEDVIDGSRVISIGDVNEAQRVRVTVSGNKPFTNPVNDWITAYDKNELPSRQVANSSEEYIPDNNGAFMTLDTTNGTAINFIFELETFASTQEARDYFDENPVTLNYQLAEPIVTPINVTGKLLGHPSGTVYAENAIGEVQFYQDGLTISNPEYPIESIDFIKKVDKDTGVETVLDKELVVIDGDTITHPDLVNDDLVSWDYYYPRELSTAGEKGITYMDSRYVLVDDTTGKYYKYKWGIDNGTLYTTAEEIE